MTLFKRSKFYYGYAVDFSNRLLEFNDGIPRQAILRPRGWAPTDYAAEIERAMNIASSQTYEVDFNRETRRITISGTTNFSMIASTDTTLSLAGFPEGAEGSDSYEGEITGFEFVPQLPLQDYTDFGEEVERRLAVENVSASGRTEQVDYGTERFMTCNIRYVTDKKVGFLENNPNAVDELKQFLNYIILKKNVEFMPDKDSVFDFTRCIYDGRPSFRLTESDGIPGFYDSGRLTFREI